MVCLPLVESRLKQIDKEMKVKHSVRTNGPAEKFVNGRELARAMLADLKGQGRLI